MTAGVATEPEAGVLEPMPLSSEKAVAFVVVHESVEVSPEVTEVGEAVREQVGAGGGVTGGVLLETFSVVVLAFPESDALLGSATVTEVEQVMVAPESVMAVPVKVVSVLIAFEVVVPESPGETEPIPWSMENSPAWGKFQERIVWSPGATEVGEAERVQEADGTFPSEPPFF